jgi:CRP-like cAMP-binding protein
VTGPTNIRNRLLRALPPGDLEQVLPDLERVDVQKGAVLVSVGQVLEFAHFPEAGLSSNVAVTDEGRRIEVGCFGFEGMVSTATVLGADRAPHELVVQVAGPWLRIEVGALQAAIRRSSALRDLLLRYAHVLMMTLSQTAMSNGIFSIEARLARWILMAHDRLDGDELPLTHEFLAIMLGTQRSGVTLAMQALEGHGAISAKRVRIIVQDRSILRALAGKSYGPAESAYEYLIGPFRKEVVGLGG